MKPYYDHNGITIYNGDCLKIMPDILDGSIDMVMTDPPYGTTACAWDSIIPLEPMWEQLKRVIKKNGAIALTASQPFTSALVMSNVKSFRHEWVWKKDKSGNIAVLKYQPAKVHESILVFGFESVLYNPQMEKRPDKNKRNNAPRINKVGVQGNKEFFVSRSRGNDDVKYPTSVKEFNAMRGGVHPTQKPVALMEYLIKTYTNEGETVLDFAMGSGTTLMAAKALGRKAIGIEISEEYCELTVRRLVQEVIPFG